MGQQAPPAVVEVRALLQRVQSTVGGLAEYLGVERANEILQQAKEAVEKAEREAGLR